MRMPARLVGARRDARRRRWTIAEETTTIARATTSTRSPSDTEASMDWQQMLVGDGEYIFLVEIVVRTTLMFLFTLALIRLLGKRGMAQLTAFELIIIVALGSAVGDPMFYPDVPLVHGFVVVATVVFLEWVLAIMTLHPKAENIIVGKPFVVIENGVVREEPLDKALLTKEELAEMLRLGGVARLDDVELAIMETAGKLSILRKREVDGRPSPEIWSLGERQ
jgi:uncharacterized membrane protein YcaP (DUF421 family)